MRIPAGYFGKLPDYPDFIKFNSGQPEVRIFDEWVQKGLYTARLKISNWKKIYKETVPYSFIMPFKETNRFLTGALYFSSDKHDREFPFIIFSDIDFNLTRLPYYLLPLFYKENINFMSDGHFNIRDIKSAPDHIIAGRTDGYISELYNEYKSEEVPVSITDELAKASPMQPLLIRAGAADNYRNYYLFICRILHLYHKARPVNSMPVVFWSEKRDSENKIFIFPDRTLSSFVTLIDSGYGGITVIASEKDETAQDNIIPTAS